MNYKFIFALLIIFCSDLNATQKDTKPKQDLKKHEAPKILLSLKSIPTATEFPCSSWLKKFGLGNSLRRLFFSDNHTK